jgi:hypothetical protein
MPPGDKTQWRVWMASLELDAATGQRVELPLVLNAKRGGSGTATPTSFMFDKMKNQLPYSSISGLRYRLNSRPNTSVYTVSGYALAHKLRDLKIGFKHRNDTVELVSCRSLSSVLKGMPGMAGIAAAFGRVVQMQPPPGARVLRPERRDPRPDLDSAMCNPTPLAHAVFSAGAESSAGRLQLHAEAGVASYHWPLEQAFPTVLHDPMLTVGEAREQVGIVTKKSELPDSMPFKRQMQPYKSWCKDPINFSRPRTEKLIKASTFADHLSTASMFLGWCSTRKGVPDAAISLELFTNPQLWTEWMSVMLLKTNTAQTLTSEASHSIKVLKWLEVQGGAALAANAAKVAHLQKVKDYMLTVVSQIRHLRPAEPRADMSLLPSKEVVWTWQQKVREDADIAGSKLRMAGSSTGPSLLSLALQMQQGLLVDFMHSYIPPFRLKALMSLVPARQQQQQGAGPSSSSGATPVLCQDADCHDPTCLGNRLMVQHDEFYAAAENESVTPKAVSVRMSVAQLFSGGGTSGPVGPGLLHAAVNPFRIKRIVVVLKHHKLERFDKGAIQFELPCALALSTHAFLELAHPIITAMTATPFLFNDKKGRQFDYGSLGQLWRKLEKDYGAPWAPILPRHNRHIHAAFCLNEYLAQAERGMEGDLHIMGNSLKAVKRHYATDCYSKAAASAIRRMTAWRLQQPKAGVVQAAAVQQQQ